jgi:hypothetical protein
LSAIFDHGILSPEGMLLTSASASSIPVIVVVLCWNEKVMNNAYSASCECAHPVHGHGNSISAA